MDFDSVVQRRRAIRRFADRPVPAEVLDAVLGNALHAPSAGFTQGWGFLVLDDPDSIALFRDTVTLKDRPWYAQAFDLSTSIEAPVVIVCWSNKSEYLERYAEPGSSERDESWWPAPYWDIDTGFAAMLMMLTAIDRELGSCFFGIAPDRVPALRDRFEVPDEFSPIGAVAIGYPIEGDHAPARPAHRPTAEVLHRGRWNA